MYENNHYIKHTGVLGMKWGKHLKSALGDASSAAREGGNLSRSIGRMSSKKKQDLSKMSDEDLRKKVSRMGLEQQYKNLTDSQTKSGSEKVARILEVSGSVLAIGASAVSIAVGIHKMRHGEGNEGKGLAAFRVIKKG